MTYFEIGAKLNRSADSVKAALNAQLRLKGEGARRRGPVIINRVPEERLADRDARLEAASCRDITAVFCGDPPKGFSALDRKRSSLLVDDAMRKRIHASSD